MGVMWSEVQEVIDILKILKDNGVDLQYIRENPDAKLKDIEGIESLIRENKWEKELSIGRATLKILESAKYIIATKSRGSSVYRVTEEQINELINLGLLTENDLQYENSGKYKMKNTSVKQGLAIDELIRVLRILKKHNFDIASLPRTRVRLGEIVELEQIVEDEKLDPIYDIGSILGQAVMAIISTENGEDIQTLYRIPKSRVDVLKGLGVTSQKGNTKFKRKKLGTKKEAEGETQKAPERALEEVSERESEKVSERESEKLPERESEKAPERESEKVPERETEEVPEKESEKTPEGEQEEDSTKIKKRLLAKIGKRGKKQQGKKTAADKLIELLDILEEYIPGISVRLPKASTKLGDIKEISDLIELIKLPKEQKISIGAVVSKAKAQAIGLYVDRRISISNIEALKKYRLLTDEEIEQYRKREESKVNGKVKTNSQILIEVLQILINHGVDILDLPRSRRKIGDIDYLSSIIQQEKIDKNYDIGSNLGNAILAMKEILSGKTSRYVIRDDEIKQMRSWGFVSDWELEKYQKRISSVQELIIMCRKLKRRGIDLRELLSYDIEIGKIEEIEGLKQIIEEEHIPERYKIGVAMRVALHTAKTTILEAENPDYRQIRNLKLLKINNEEIDELRTLGLLTEASMETFRKTQAPKLNVLLTERALTEYKSGDKSEALNKIMRDAVAQYVEDNETTRRELAELVLSREEKNRDNII